MPSMTPDMPNREPEQPLLRRIGLQPVAEKRDMPNHEPEEPAGDDRLKTYPTYWRSLEQMADTPEFRAELERQPALGAEEALHASRRRFLQTMAASLGLAGLATTGCIRLPEEILAPYAHRPENRTPGNPVSYATAMEIGGVAQGLLVTSYDGRPIKIEGNPSHPLNRGAADFLAQASVLELYDPDRSFGVVYRKDGKAIDAIWSPVAQLGIRAPSNVIIDEAFNITVSAMDAATLPAAALGTENDPDTAIVVPCRNK